MCGNMILLIGASASGKTEVGKILEKKYGYKKVVTYTTRKMRDNEVADVDYHFISKQDFLVKNEEGFFFETMVYNDHFYGTALVDLVDKSYIILDPSGLNKYKESQIFNVAFYLNASKDIREGRMKKRGDAPQDIVKRLAIDDVHFSIRNLSKIDFSIDIALESVDEVADKIIGLYNTCSMDYDRQIQFDFK